MWKKRLCVGDMGGGGQGRSYFCFLKPSGKQFEI